MTLRKTTTAALILAAFAVVGGVVIVVGVIATPTYAQLPDDIEDIVDDAFERVGIVEEEEDTNIEQQSINQENDLDQEVVKRSEDFDEISTNIEIKAEVNDNDITQGLEEGDDNSASLSPESEDDEKKYSSSSSNSRCVTHIYGEPPQEC